jgi:hypothetical protein
MIKARQLIYTRVEPEYSPLKKPGYQVFYRSPSLPQEPSMDILRRVRFFSAANPQTVRLQFFRLPSGEQVFTRTAYLPIRPGINNRAESQRVYCAHCLVLSAVDFSRLGNQPFAIFDRAPFVTDPEELVREYDLLTGRERPMVFEPPEMIPPTGADAWSSEAGAVYELSRLALKPRQDQPLVQLVGEWNASIDILRSLFWYIPPAVRTSCTFNTWVDERTDLSAYWLVSNSDASLQAPYTVMMNGLQIPGVATAPEDDLYAAWLELKKGQHTIDWVYQLASVQEMCTAFRERRRLIAGLVSKPTAEEFFAVNRETVAHALERMLNAMFSATVAQAFLPYLLETEPDKRHLISAAAASIIPVRLLAVHLHGWLLTQAPDFAVLKRPADWQAIEKVADQAKDFALLFWVSVVRKDARLRRNTLKTMRPEDFELALALLLNPFAPAEYACRQHLPRLLTALASRWDQVTDPQYVELVETVVQLEAVAHLSRMRVRLQSVSEETQAQLEHILHRVTNLPADFEKDLERQRQRLGPPPGPFAWIFRARSH